MKILYYLNTLITLNVITDPANNYYIENATRKNREKSPRFLAKL